MRVTVVLLLRSPSHSAIREPYANIIRLVGLMSDCWRFLQGCFQTWRFIWIILVLLGLWLKSHDRRYPYTTIGTALLLVGIPMGVLHIANAQW